MQRRDFLKNSIGALLFGALTSNKAIASVVETLTPTSPNILLYLVQTVKGEWKIKATKWVDLPNKRLIPSEVNPETFKALEIVDLQQVNKQRRELWIKHNCTGKMGHLIKMGIPMDDEIKNEYIQLGLNQSGLKRTPETLQRMRKVNLGKKHSDKTKEICRQKSIGLNVGRKHTQDAKDKLSKAKKGIKASDETKKILSEAQKKRTNHFNEEAIKNRRAKTLKPILCYSYTDMIFICEYESITSASKHLNLNKGGIGKILNKQYKQSKGYYFEYK
jgi:hypothetical protein